MLMRHGFDVTNTGINGLAGIEKIACFATLLPFRPFDLNVGDRRISCRHPVTNEGTVDIDYLVVAVEGFEGFEIWVFRGQVDIKSTRQRFELYGVTTEKLNRLTTIYRKAFFLSLLKRIFLQL